MNKAELIEVVAEAVNDTKAAATRMVEAVLESIKKGLKNDGTVALVGHGTYSVVARDARKGRNPRTGEEMLIPASKTVKFKVGKDLKEEVK